MYGTIARLQPKPGHEAELEDYGRRVAELEVSGYRGSYLFTPDHNPYKVPTTFLIAIFDDQATYQANADSPEQNERYQEMRALLDADPDWMDGTFVEG